MQHLEIETPEHVVLDLEIAGVGSRGLAMLIDLALLGGGTFGLGMLIWLLLGFGMASTPWLDAVLLLALGSAWLLYFAFFEGLRGGQTPGKRRVGIRVVSDTGHAVTFGAAVVRNLLRLADLLPPPYLTGIVLAALHPRGKRLGDLAAGTVVVRDRPAEVHQAARATTRDILAVPEPELASFADTPALGDAEFRLLSTFASRYHDLPEPASTTLAARMAERLGVAVPDAARAGDHLLDLHRHELARRQGRLASAGHGRLAFRFAEQKAARWEEFRVLAERAARDGLDRFRAGELPDFAARYREIAADLARARTYRAAPETLHALERLVTAGHNALYREERHTWRQIWTTVAHEFPAAVVQARHYVALAGALFLLPAAAGYVMLREQPALAADLLPEVMLRRAEAGVVRQAEGQKYVTIDAQERPLMASGIISNNVRVALLCFASGIFFGVGSLILIAYNGLLIGITAAHFDNMGVLAYLLEFIAGHGPLEIFAIWVAAAAGFLLGRAVLAPGRFTRADALVLHSRTALRLVGATVVCLVVAGVIEGFVSAGDWGITPRLWISGASLLFLVLYLANGYSSRNIPRIRMARASTSRKLVLVPSSNLPSSSSKS